ncbi:MAG: hypothetical protein ACOYT8_04685 [Candidatus Dependentiae bacterium]
MKHIYFCIGLLFSGSFIYTMNEDMPLPADISSPTANKEVSQKNLQPTMPPEDQEEDDEEEQEDDLNENEKIPSIPAPATDYNTQLLQEIKNELSEIKKSLNELIEFKRPQSAQENMVQEN